MQAGRDLPPGVAYLARPGRPAVVSATLDEFGGQWLNGRTQRIWRDLNLPRGVRQAWESRYPQLRQAA